MIGRWLHTWTAFACLNSIYCFLALTVLKIDQLLIGDVFEVFYPLLSSVFLLILLAVYPFSLRLWNQNFWVPFVLIVYLMTAFVSSCFFEVEKEFYFSYYVAFFVMSIFPIVLRLIVTSSRHVKNAQIIADDQVQDTERTIFRLHSETGKVVLSVPFDRITYFEASDNYVICYYLDASDKLKKSMNRVSMKKIEELLQGSSTFFARIHKSFIINVKFVEGISGKVQSYKLEMMYTEALLPVSRSFDIQPIKDKLNY